MIYLASESPRRRRLLKEAGWVFRIVKSRYSERPFAHSSPARWVCDHAAGKALSAAARLKSGLILAADTIVFDRGEVIGKPKGLKDAFRILGSLQGRWHCVYTGVALVWVREGRIRRKRVFSERTKVHIRAMTPQDMRRYFKRIDPLDKAGAYAIQQKRGSVVDGCIGSFSNAVGLPMERLERLLSR